MEDANELVLTAITHAIAAVMRRREGMAGLSARHSSASRSALIAMTRRARTQ